MSRSNGPNVPPRPSRHVARAVSPCLPSEMPSVEKLALQPLFSKSGRPYASATLGRDSKAAVSATVLPSTRTSTRLKAFAGTTQAAQPETGTVRPANAEMTGLPFTTSRKPIADTPLGTDSFAVAPPGIVAWLTRLGRINSPMSSPSVKAQITKTEWISYFGSRRLLRDGVHKKVRCQIGKLLSCHADL